MSKLLAALAAALALITSITVVMAHSRPVRLDPPPGAILSSAPAKVEGWFNAEVRKDPNWTFIHVSDAQGNRVDTGDTEISPDRLHMTATLKPDLSPGSYLVTWRTYDDGDGAVFGDCYTFFVGQAAADQAVSNKSRLDGGANCQRIDVEGNGGTPVAGGTPQADDGAAAANSSSENGGIPTWALVVGVIGGLVVGGAGVHFMEKRS